MDNKDIITEMENVVGNLDSKDEDTAEYSRAVNNASKLQQMALNLDEFEEKKRRNTFDEKMRVKQFNLEKRKFEEDIRLKDDSRLLDEQRVNNQHIEKMKELEIAELKLKNENIVLTESQKKTERDFKLRKIEFWAGTAVKIGLTALTLFLYTMMHKDELTFERSENGLVPNRCKGYDDVMIKASQTILK